NVKNDKYGFIESQPYRIGTVATSRPGIFVAGCAEGPKDIQNSVVQSQAAVAEVISLFNR
ncbi:MAG: pyridine nucleotide-disulfide oxidoreductase, partial [Candidatus Cloacimonadota bacterium]|nr:pyridine nucleotide-disulfide oxidoreductase [Candidatus Cloacimonadota bacterium]